MYLNDASMGMERPQTAVYTKQWVENLGWLNWVMSSKLFWGYLSPGYKYLMARKPWNSVFFAVTMVLAMELVFSGQIWTSRKYGPSLCTQKKEKKKIIVCLELFLNRQPLHPPSVLGLFCQQDYGLSTPLPKPTVSRELIVIKTPRRCLCYFWGFCANLLFVQPQALLFALWSTVQKRYFSNLFGVISSTNDQICPLGGTKNTNFQNSFGALSNPIFLP